MERREAFHKTGNGQVNPPICSFSQKNDVNSTIPQKRVPRSIRGLLCCTCIAYILFVYYLTRSPFIIIVAFIMIIGTLNAKVNSNE